MTVDPFLTRPFADEESTPPPATGDAPDLPSVKLVQGHIGPYQLVGELGSGRNGIVYAARREYENGVQRVVAIKVLRRSLLEQPKVAERFVREGLAAMRVKHPSVCAVYDVGRSEEGIPFVVSEYLIGEPFSRLQPLLWRKKDPYSAACCVKLVASLCEGLQAVHEVRDEQGRKLAGLHRQIHPHNVFAMFDGTARLLDLSGAASADTLTPPASGHASHEYAYMAPEQIRGEQVDAGSDIWSLGVLLWEGLAGRSLFQRPSAVATAVAVLEGPIPNITEISPNVHVDVAAVLAKMLERDPARRYGSAREAGGDLELALRRSFGQLSTSKLAAWLNALFPGCEEFRWRLVHHASAGGTVPEHVRSAPIVAVASAGEPRQYNVPQGTPAQPFIAGQLGHVATSVKTNVRPSREATAIVTEDELRALASGLDADLVQFHPAPASAAAPAPAAAPALARAVHAGSGTLQPQAYQQPQPHAMPSPAPEPLPRPPATPTQSLLSQIPARLSQLPSQIYRYSISAGALTSPVPRLPFKPLISSGKGAILGLALAGLAAILLWPREADAPTAQLQATKSAEPQTPAAQPETVQPVLDLRPSDAEPPAPVLEEPAAAPQVAAAPAAESPVAKPRPDPKSREDARPRRAPARAPAEEPSTSSPIVAFGQVYLSAKQGTFFVLHEGRERPTPTSLRLPAGSHTLRVRRDHETTSTPITVNIEAGRLIALPLE